MQRVEHREGDWKFPFISYTPESMTEKMPLMIQLHGAGERGDGKEDLSLVEIYGFPKVLKEQETPCILIAPQCPLDSFWAARVESIIEFVAQLKEYYPVDEDRVYLTGLSMGGFGTWFTAMARPDLFAAIAPICGGGMPWNAGVLTMPIWAFHGAEDDVVTPRHSDEMVEKLKEAGADVTYTRVDGIGHNVWDIAYNQELLNWLLQKKR